MSGTLFIRIDDSLSERITWLAIEASGTPLAQPESGTLSQAAKYSAGRRVLVFVPTTELLLTQTAIPTRNRQRILTAVPYIMENLLVDDVDSLHFALGTIDAENSVTVAAVSHERMDQWLIPLTEAGIKPNAVYPDIFGLPMAPSHWTVLAEKNTALVRTGHQSGFTVDIGNLSILLRLSLEQHKDDLPEGFDLIECSQISTSGLEFSFLQEHELGLRRHDCTHHPLLLLASKLEESQAINLLQGRYRPSAKHTKYLKPWIPAASLLMVLILIQSISGIAHYFALDRENKVLSEQIEQLFKTSFPEVRNVVDPKIQMQQKLAELRGSSASTGNFLSMVGKLGRPLKSIPSIEIASTRFHDGQIDLQLTVRDLPSLEQLKQKIEAQNFKVEIRSATAQGQTVSSQLRITGEGS